MKALLLALTLFLTASPQSQPAADAGSIEGVVVKLGTSDPVTRARVTMNTDGGRGVSMQALTDGGGKFVFDKVPPGRYRLQVTRDGYVPSQYGQRGPSLPGTALTLAARQALQDIRLDLMPTGAISGRIYDRYSEPVANANVQALKYIYQDGRRVLSAMQSARTNDLGEYRLFWMQPGQYIISVMPTGSPIDDVQRIVASMATMISLGGTISGGGSSAGNRAQDTGVAYVPVYYPGTTDVSGAAPVDIGPGANFGGVDLVVADARAVSIRGRVVNGTGAATNGTSIMLMPRGSVLGGQNQRGAGAGPDGTFEFRGIPPGAYDLVATANRQPILPDKTVAMAAAASRPDGFVTFAGPAGGVLAGRVALDVGGGDIDGITIPLQSGFNLSGRISIDNRSADSGDAAMTNIRVQLRPDPLIPQLTPPVTSVTADGSFMVSGISPGDYRLSVNPLPRNSYLRSATLAGSDVANMLLHVDRDPQGQLFIEIGSNPGSLDAVVQDDKQQPVSSTTVVLVPDAKHRLRSELYRMAISDVSGRIHLDGIAPGDYKLFAWESVENGAWQDPDFILKYEDLGRAVHIGEGSRESAEVRLIPR